MCNCIYGGRYWSWVHHVTKHGLFSKNWGCYQHQIKVDASMGWPMLRCPHTIATYCEHVNTHRHCEHGQGAN
jgi:hypothetical protein